MGYYFKIVQRGVLPNFELLENAIQQSGPWAGQYLKLDKNWIVSELSRKIRELDWPVVRNDVARFLKPHEQKALEYWQADFVLETLKRIQRFTAS